MVRPNKRMQQTARVFKRKVIAFMRRDESSNGRDRLPRGLITPQLMRRAVRPRRLRWRPGAVCLVVWASFPGPPVDAQERGATPAGVVYAGAGNAFGGVGIVSEYVVWPNRISALAGTGFFPFGDQWIASVAASVRGYVGSQRHRAFVDLSWSVLSVSRAAFFGAPVIRDYGPGVLVGYSHVASRRLIVMGGAGIGFANSGETVAVLQLGIGWVWRSA